MFENVSPERAGISSKNIEEFICYLNENNLATHSVMLVRGNKVFFRAGWKPFAADSLHRMYSETKSFAGIAVCHLIGEGKIGLKDKIITYFGDKLPAAIPPELEAQTVEDMLTMRTCMSGNYWFGKGVNDRVSYYFSCPPSKRPGGDYYYDSDGSFILCALVERITGKNLLTFLREVCLNEIGFSEDAFLLNCPGGYSWGDSGLVCRVEDICRFARLLANGGKWNGKQLLNKDIVLSATKKHTDTSTEKYPYEKCGYGCQIWQNTVGGFSFQGMHGQYMHYDPKTDIIFACTSGNIPGESGHIIYEGVKKFIFDRAENPLPENTGDFNSLKNTAAGLTLLHLSGGKCSDAEKDIAKNEYIFADNPMGLKRCRFAFTKEDIVFKYENAQGEKKIVFGRNKNRFGVFPQTGYSRETGGIPYPGNSYKCAASAAWTAGDTLSAKVQITDIYIGILDITFTFKENSLTVIMQKVAEDFLNEYEGTAIATPRR